MRVARFRANGAYGWGFVDGDAVRPVADGPDLLDVLGDPAALGDLSRRSTGELALGSVDLLAPIPNPPQFVGIGLNYRAHAAESGATVPTSPVSFPFFNSSIINPGDAILLPPFTDEGGLGGRARGGHR